jgi:hypothetical protein
LLSRAAEHLLEAQRLDAHNPRNESFERRLQWAARYPTGKTTARRPPRPATTDEEVERTARELPPGVVEAFTANVQPVLLNRCAANCCHGPTSQAEYRLLRPTVDGEVTRRLTQRNLHASLQMVDKEAPKKSPLLMMPSAAHGNAPKAVFGKQDAQQYDRIKAWVRLVTSGRGGVQPAAFFQPDHAALQASSGERPADQGRTSSALETGNPAAGIRGVCAQDGIHPSDSPQHEFPRPFGQGQTPRHWSPKDPFDPELFNRRFFPPED